ncbi:hypothetical protein ASC77_20820 [Nocardioides sp. Root1257]|uniref:WXG100 family type VII secretion target n=1 Tax=unclassified Nocardioides TaxID=2615069 RepID=UPI0006FEDE5F|nr:MULTISPECIES: hypothetical protein [unclassified Nocardioides]KQW45217.1 hypothetical protein ASC77_20820 [Nocardioides sp. Root1257]KRC52508.1 hypothetical protein ASE24_25240 [Nocardioides sp. Root224]
MGFGEDLLDDTVTELRSILADLQGIDLWPPWDAAETIVRLVSRAVEIASQPPEPDPSNLRDAADEWRLIATTTDRAHASLESLHDEITTAIWEGDAGNGFRSSVTVLSDKVDTVPEAARGVATALDTMAGSMDAARKRHADAFDGLRDHLSISWDDALPWELVSKLSGIVGEVIDAVQDLIGAYEDAAEAAATARRAVVTAMDGIELPDHLPSAPGAVPSTIDLVNQWSDDEGPLDGSTLSRYDDALGAMSADERAEVRRLLEGSDPAARAWIMAAVASGLSGDALTNYAHQLDQMSPSELRDLDPSGFRGDQATQPDQTTCGSSSLVMSRMENDPAYAMWMQTGYDPLTGETDPRTPEERFADESQAMHVRTNLPVDRDHDLQFPWPPQAGTQPWALAAEMSADGGSGVPGTSYDVTVVDPDDRGRSFDAVVRASEDGSTVPIYVGDDTRPGHVTLVTASQGGDTLSVYDPSEGSTITVSRDDWVNGTLDVAGWSEPWFVVVPES